MIAMSSLLALFSATAYSTDVIFAKQALNNMPIYIFLLIVCSLYVLLSIAIILWKRKEVVQYFTTKKNTKYVVIAVLGLLVGTMLADILMWLSIKLSKKHHLPVTVTLIHMTPVLSLLLVVLFYKVSLRWQAIAGVLLAVLGCAIMIHYTDIYQTIS